MPAHHTAPPPASSSPPATLVARHLAHDRGGAAVLDDISLTVGPESCVGVIGPNGVGKSTLLQILAGTIRPDAGTVTLDPPTATVGYLAQEHEAAEGESVRDWLSRRTGSREAEVELAAAAAGLSGGGPAAERRYEVALERFTGLGVADVDARHRRGHRRPRPGGGAGLPGGVDPVGGPAGQGGPGCRRTVRLRRDPARRADQRPRLRGPGPAGVPGALPKGRDGHRLPRPGLPGPDGGHRARAGPPPPFGP